MVALFCACAIALSAMLALHCKRFRHVMWVPCRNRAVTSAVSELCSHCSLYSQNPLLATSLGMCHMVVYVPDTLRKYVSSREFTNLCLASVNLWWQACSVIVLDALPSVY